MDRNTNFTTIALWLSYVVTIIYLVNSIGVLTIPIAAIMMVPLIVMMNFLWRKPKRESLDSLNMQNTEKRKRQRIDDMLSDMSDEELFELRQRLQDGTYDEDYLYDNVVGDDGELVMR